MYIYNIFRPAPLLDVRINQYIRISQYFSTNFQLTEYGGEFDAGSWVETKMEVEILMRRVTGSN